MTTSFTSCRCAIAVVLVGAACHMFRRQIQGRHTTTCETDSKVHYIMLLLMEHLTCLRPISLKTSVCCVSLLGRVKGRQMNVAWTFEKHFQNVHQHCNIGHVLHQNTVNSTRYHPAARRPNVSINANLTSCQVINRSCNDVGCQCVSHDAVHCGALCDAYIRMSVRQYYLLPAKDVYNLGGPLSVFRFRHLFTCILVVPYRSQVFLYIYNSLGYSIGFGRVLVLGGQNDVQPKTSADLQ